MSFKLTVLGSSSAIPAYGRGLSAQVLEKQNKNYLVDCGEGTQFRFIQNRIKFSRLDSIFISHLHGDHVYGLPGLISTMSMQGRKKDLKLYGPPGLRSLIEHILDFTETHLNFALLFNKVDTSKYQLIKSDELFKVYSIPLDHRIPACGYKFVEKASLNMKRETIDKFGLGFDQIRSLIAGKDVQMNDGTLVRSCDHTFERFPAKSYVYLSDSTYQPGISHYFKSVDLIFHESTYMHELSVLAKERKHATALQAAKIAREAGAGKLILGHFSSRYRDLEPLLQEARSIFPESHLGLDGTIFEC